GRGLDPYAVLRGARAGGETDGAVADDFEDVLLTGMDREVRSERERRWPDARAIGAEQDLAAVVDRLRIGCSAGKLVELQLEISRAAAGGLRRRRHGQLDRVQRVLVGRDGEDLAVLLERLASGDTRIGAGLVDPDLLRAGRGLALQRIDRRHGRH